MADTEIGREGKMWGGRQRGKEGGVKKKKEKERKEI